ncbi:multidrug resistance ABC transporter ATP-binding/permease [Lactococcus fujiensis JCM 16395]|uniref:Multidrug resistance ABC transporter ATP-binding/permease n=2 Tax=Lactococcus fujiensis TaxID=610251 RepID=A0A2A5RJ82_9LACT|nr:multidrug resistance ABC transporter ATP-binding/permease [Lactococcus fujiensis JCM 16395]
MTKNLFILEKILMKIFKELWWFFKSEKKGYGIGLFALFMVSMTHLIPPLIIGKVIDHIVKHNLTWPLLTEYLIILLATALFEYASRFIWSTNIWGEAFRLEKIMRAKLFHHFLKMDTLFYQKNRTGDLMAHATNDLNAIQEVAGLGVLTWADSMMTGGTTIAAMLIFIDWRLTIIAVLPLPLLALVSKTLGDRIHESFELAQETFSEMNDKVQESITGMKAIKSFGEEEQDKADFQEKLDNIDKAYVKVNWIDSMYDPLITFIVGISYTLTILLGGYYVVHNVLSLGQLVSFMTYIGNLVWPMFAIGMLFNVMERGRASYSRVEKLLDQKAESKVADGKLDMPEKGTLSFDVQNFAYPDDPKVMIKDITFDLEPGHLIGLVGRTGSGKSSIIKLLMREFDHYEGRIAYANQDIMAYKLDEYLPSIGYVPQEHFLFSMNIRDNIRFGKATASQAEVEKAAQIAGIHDDIIGFSEGYDTMVGERGVSLSGGQKQRLSIARALLVQPKLLILDDALSAVDAKTENEILGNLKRRRKESATVIVSHRLSSVMEADEILVLEGGKVTERGKHEALVQLDQGWYAKMWQMQQIESHLGHQTEKEGEE